jgi:hypothetical protein
MLRISIIVAAAVLALSGCGSSTNKSSPATTSAPHTIPPPTVPTSAPALPAPTTAPPTTAPPPTPAPARTTAPAATAAAVAAADLCGAPANPMGYNLCGRGQQITKADSRTCTYFKCISNFDKGTGFMIECADGTYSMSGGKSGSCSTHGGPGKPVSSGP